MKTWIRIYLSAAVLLGTLSVWADGFAVEKTKAGVTVKYDGKLFTRYVIGQSNKVRMQIAALVSLFGLCHLLRIGEDSYLVRMLLFPVLEESSIADPLWLRGKNGFDLGCQT